MEEQDWKELYKDTSDWLKFVEVKITALLTFETGLFYFISKLQPTSENSIFICLSFIGMVLSICCLVWAILPTISDSKNPMYFLSWSDENFSLPIDFKKEDCYQQQIREISKVTKNKMMKLRLSIIVYFVSILFFIVFTQF
ncbi:hypothetical protein ACXM1Q_004280 [Streptococcus sp. 10F2]